MNGVFLLSTRMRMYLTEIPIIALMAAAIHFNGTADGWAKLYPLIIACGAGIVFIYIYLLRAVIITNEEVRSFGAFSSKDKATISKGKTLTMTLKPKKKIKIELFGEDEAPMLDWARDRGPCRANLYRDVAIGGEKSVKRVLRYFGMEIDDIRALISGEKERVELYGISAYRSVNTDEVSYSLDFSKTL